MSIEYRKGNLFDAPPGVALIQACNCQGSWGSGVAAGFRAKFEYAHKEYQRHCRKHAPLDFRKRSPLIGTSHSTFDEMDKRKGATYLVCSLFTSNNYARFVDAPDKIVKATDDSLVHFLSDPNLKKVTEIHSPKMNAGLFNVPWELTAAVIEKHLETLGKKWVVWELG